MPYETGGKLFTVKETSDILKVETKIIKKDLREGRLHGIRLDDRWLVPEASIKAVEALQEDRAFLMREVSALKETLTDFFSMGDISESYYNQAMKRLDQRFQGYTKDTNP